jgi:multiple sugar transport system ATP-binding protein
MAQLVLSAVTKSFGGLRVIHGVDLKVDDGEFVVFVGPSGCGKSTLLRLIAGLEQPTTGEIAIAGARVNDVPASDRGLAMVFQSYALYPHMSVYQNMAFGLENIGLPRAEIDKRVGRAATMLRLTEYLQRKPKELSGGQRQRVAIGRAVVRDPKIFLFDEPLSNLDAELRVATRKELAALHDEIGGTMIYVTHDQVEAMTLADRIVVLRAGIVEQIGTPLALYNTPDNLFVATFIGSPKMNLIKATVARSDDSGVDLTYGADRTISIAQPAHRLPVGAAVALGIRPEHCDIAASGNADLEATVDLAECLGSETYFTCAVDQIGQFTLHAPGQVQRQRGDTLRLNFDREHLHLFDSEGRALLHGLPRSS